MAFNGCLPNIWQCATNAARKLFSGIAKENIVIKNQNTTDYSKTNGTISQKINQTFRVSKQIAPSTKKFEMTSCPYIVAPVNNTLNSNISKARDIEVSNVNQTKLEGELAEITVNDLGVVDFGTNIISSKELKNRLIDFAKKTGYSITVVGGDRTKERNQEVGGSPTSRHLNGDAADIVVKGTSNLDVAIKAHKTGLFNTTIYYPEGLPKGALPPHVHVDLKPDNNNILRKYEFENGSGKYPIWNPKY